MFITSFLHLNKYFWLFWGSSNVTFVTISQNFFKSPLKFCLISRFQFTAYGMYGDGQPSSAWDWSTKLCMGLVCLVLFWNGQPSSVLEWTTKFCMGLVNQVLHWNAWEVNQILHGSDSAWELSTKFCMWMVNQFLLGVISQVLHGNCQPSSACEWSTKLWMGMVNQVLHRSGQPSSTWECSTKFYLGVVHQALHGSGQPSSAWEWST